MKRATFNAAGEIQCPELSIQEQLTFAIHAASCCKERLHELYLLPETREWLEENLKSHMQDVARLQRLLDEEGK